MLDSLPSPNGEIVNDLDTLQKRALYYIGGASAANTKRAYRAAWSDFARWCQGRGLEALPASPATVGLYLVDAAEKKKVSTLRLRLAAISQAHRISGYKLDVSAAEIRNLLNGVVRIKGAKVYKKEAITREMLHDCIQAYATGGRLKAKRDRALLSVGFFAALRRSELAAITIEDLTFTAEGVVLSLPKRKNDQNGLGSDVGLPFKENKDICPVRALREWLSAARLTSGPVFCVITKGDRPLRRRIGDRDVARIIKAATYAAGYDPEIYGGHSLRSGFITTAAREGVAERIIAQQSGHRSFDVLRGYVRRSGVFNENAASMI